MANILIISAIIVFIIDGTDFFDRIFKGVWDWIWKGKRVYSEERLPLVFHPFFCSLCAVWWTGLAYLIVTGTLTVPMVGYVALLSFLTPIMKDVMIVVKDLLTKLLDLID